MRNPLVTALLTTLLCGCAVNTHATQKPTRGVPRSSADLLAVIDQPGPITLETIVSCDWRAERALLINLEHPRAKEAGLTNELDEIQVFFHVLRHPTHGTFIVDTGVEKALRDHPSEAVMGGAMASILKIETMKFNEPLGDWLAKQPQPVQGVFLTHIHLDHSGGLPDVPAETAIYLGPGELSHSKTFNPLMRSGTERAFQGKAPVNEWAYTADATGRFEGVLDIFGDGSVWALWVPGHTPGSTAYLVRTTRGPVLLTGDASHTRWGWEHDVEPGTSSADIPRSADSFARLRKLATEHPTLDVRLGHQ